ncbi:hypothetical protein GCM10028857_24410 [Salinarchaeum chitinilyticum]
MDIAEKRVYDAANAGRTRLAVATGQGLAVVGISADVIGEFGLALREPVRDVVAAGDGRLLVATDEDLLVVALGDDGVAATVSSAGTGAGGTAAVTVADDAVVAAGSDGVVRRAPRSAVLGTAIEHAGDDDPAAWTDLGEATVRAADRTLLATPGGVYRAGDSSIEHVGLDDARDVAAPANGTAGPFAATGSGLFRLGPGWTEERAGAFDLVATVDGATEPASDAGDERGPAAYAAAGTDLLARTDGAWSPIEWPAASPVAGVACDDDGNPIYAVAADGTVCADAGDGWRTRSIGLRNVTGCCVVE